MTERLDGRLTSSRTTGPLRPGTYRVWIVPYKGTRLHGLRSNVETRRFRR